MGIMSLKLGLGLDSGSNTASTETPLLDTHQNAQAAYSYNRKLRTAYTGNAFRIRRDNDDAEEDIGFDGNAVSETEITDFVGSNSAYVVTEYDHSGNGNDRTQSTANKQPLIVNAGTVSKVDGYIAIFSDTTAGQQDNLSVTLTTVNPSTAFHVVKTTRDKSNINRGLSGYYGLLQNGSATDSWYQSGSPSVYVNGGAIGDSRDNLYDEINGVLALVTYINLNLATGWGEYNTDFQGSDSFLPPDYILETIIYGSDKSSDRSEIDADIVTYYSL